MQDELVKLVVQKTGISQELATQAVTTVLDYLKAKLPAPIGGQLESLLGGKAPDLSALSGLLGGNQ